jgi:transcriptional regulator with XRE-family HTH domain
MDIDFAKVTAELVRALRGRRSQVALSRRMKFRTNVVYAWEKGRRQPSLLQLLQLAELVGADLQAAFARMYPIVPPWLQHDIRLSSLESAAQLLRDSRGAMPVVHLAKRTGLSRFAIARWLAGATEPRAWEFLCVLHHCTHRLLDFLDPLTQGKPLASLKLEYERVSAARLVAERHPMSQVLLRCLELESNSSSKSEPSYAAKLGISVEQERQILSLLEATGQIAHDGVRWRLLSASPLNMRLHRETAHLHREFWVEMARLHAPHAADALCAYNVCGVSREGFDQLKRLQREYLQKARAVIEASEPVQRVVLMQINVVSLVEDAPRA